MKKQFFFMLLALCVLIACQQEQDPAPLNQQQLVEKGRYLITIGGCHDCHTPKTFTEKGPEPNMDLQLSGHPEGTPLPPIDKSLVGPEKWVLMTPDLTATVGSWGISYAANLTPDDQTGIGLWKLEHFVQAMRTGKHMGAGRPILPPMPWQNLKNAKETDLEAMFVFMKSLPPIKNQVPGPVPPDAIE